MENAIRIFSGYLNSRGLKLTRERKAVLKQLFSHQGHLEAEELVHGLRRRKARASRATIYRTLDLLVQSGLVRKLDLGQGHSHYELALDRPHHGHMICLECGRVIEFSDKTIHRSLDELCKRERFKRTSHRFQVFGYCQKCVNRKAAVK